MDSLDRHDLLLLLQGFVHSLQALHVGQDIDRDEADLLLEGHGGWRAQLVRNRNRLHRLERPSQLAQASADRIGVPQQPLLVEEDLALHCLHILENPTQLLLELLLA